MAEKEVKLSDYLSALLRYKYLIILVLLIFTSAGFVFYRYEIPTYTATAYMVVGKETIGQTYDITAVQQVDTLVTLAKSYPFIYQVVKKLNLTQYPIKSGLIDRVTTGVSEEYLDLKQLSLYYVNNVNVAAKRGTNILTISVTSQDSKVAANLANDMGTYLIDQSVTEKEAIIRTNLGYLDDQLASLSELIAQNRKEKEQKESSFAYQQVADLQNNIEIQENVLNLFVKEKEYLIASIALNENETESENDQERLEYVDVKIAELQSSLDSDKNRLRDIDKDDFYQVEDLEFSMDTNEDMYQGLMSERQKIILASLIESKDIKFLSRAYVPLSSDKMRGIMIILIFAGVGAGFAFGLIQFIELMNRKFKSSEDIEESLGLKVIGNLPLVKDKVSVIIDPIKHPKDPLVESYRTLATNVKFATRDKDIKSVLVTSDRPETGKSLTLSNLAITMADAGSKILLVDVDLRRPTLHKIFHTGRKPGITDVLAGKADLKKAIVKVNKNIYLLPAGSLSYNPQSVIESKAMHKMMDSFRKYYDLVLYDSIPLTSFSDVAILASITDASVLVMDETKSERSSMEFAKERLEEIGSNVLGIAVNKTKKKYKKYHYYYYYKDEEESGKGIKHKKEKTEILKKIKKGIKKSFKREDKKDSKKENKKLKKNERRHKK